MVDINKSQLSYSFSLLIGGLKMRTIYTTDLSRYGNDCYIYETISLIEDNGIYNTILTTKVSDGSMICL